MSALNNDGHSRKRKRSEEESLLEEHTSGDDSQNNGKKRQRKLSAVGDIANTLGVAGCASKKKKQLNKSCDSVTEDVQPKNKKAMEVDVDDSITEDVQPKERKNDNGTEKGDSQSKKEKKNKTENLISCVLDYLHQWKDNVNGWKFSKYYQSCLINFINDPTIVSEEDFVTSLQYMKKCRGNAKKKLKMKASAVINGDEESEIKANGMKASHKSDEEKRQQKKNTAKDDACNLFVKNLPYGQTKEDVRNGLMKIFTAATDVRMPFKDSTKYIGFAFVEFSQPSDVTSALSEKQGVKLYGRALLLDRVGSRNKSIKHDADDKRKSLSPEFIADEKLRRAQEVLQMFR